jgi:acyl dehydratase
MIGRTIDQLAVGDTAELSRRVTDASIACFVDAVGDRNPIHSDPSFAETTSFRGPIAPGIWTAGLISAVLGTQLPGPGGIYVSQSLRFHKPVKLGDRITARVEVVELIPERNRVRLKTTCLNQGGEEVLSGEAWVLPPKLPIDYAGRPPAAALLSSWALWPFACAAQAISVWWGWGGSALATGSAQGRCERNQLRPLSSAQTTSGFSP